MNDDNSARVERNLEILIKDLRPYADRPVGTVRIDMDDVKSILALYDASPSTQPEATGEDDLCARLRRRLIQNPHALDFGQPCTIHDLLTIEAADRITTLTAERDAARHEQELYRIADLELLSLLYKFGSSSEFSKGWNAALDAIRAQPVVKDA